MAHADIRPGTKLYSAESECEIVVVRAPGVALNFECGGSPMVDERPTDGPTSAADDDDVEILIGKRYTDEDGRVEVLCTRSGSGPLTVDGQPLTLMQAKPLPASD